MFGSDPLKIPRRFVDCINARDVSALREVLANACRIIDARGAWIEGRDLCVEAVEKFFAMEPDYQLHVASMGRAGGNVLIKGHTTASDPLFAATTLWRARSDGRHLHEWQSYSSQVEVSVTRLVVGEKARIGPYLEESY